MININGIVGGKLKTDVLVVGRRFHQSGHIVRGMRESRGRQSDRCGHEKMLVFYVDGGMVWPPRQLVHGLRLNSLDPVYVVIGIPLAAGQGRTFVCSFVQWLLLLFGPGRRWHRQ